MDIGTAKPTRAELAAVPHHLIDVANPDETWSLALYQSSARAVIADIHRRGKIPILVGGTGQYLWAVLKDWRIPPQAPDPRLRQALEKWADEIGPEALYARLASVDPQAAARIEPRNLRRTVRALEVMFNTGQRFSAQRLVGDAPYAALQIGLIRPRAELYARIDARIDAMLSGGLITEVQALLAEGYSPELPTLSAIGYREVCAYLQGSLSLDEAAAQMKRLTRQFVRRQANWFKADDPSIHWFDAGKASVAEIVTFIQTCAAPEPQAGIPGQAPEPDK
jgi:tRNA dimethylallyltransferase